MVTLRRKGAELATIFSSLLKSLIPDAASVLIASQKALKAGKNRPNIQLAIEMISNAMTMPMDQGLATERDIFQTLRVGVEAKALRHQFFAERKLFKALGSNELKPKSLENIAVIGAGTMGSGITIACLSAGYSVLMLDQNEAALEKGVKKVTDFYDSRVTSGKLLANKAEAILKGFTFSTQWTEIASADLVIEAVFEDMQVKHAVFQKIEEYVNSDALLA